MLKNITRVACGVLFLYISFLMLAVGKQVVANAEQSAQYVGMTFYISAFTILVVAYVLGLALKCLWYGIFYPIFGFILGQEEPKGE